MSIILIVVVVAVIAIAVGRIKAMVRLNRRRAWTETEYS